MWYDGIRGDDKMKKRGRVVVYTDEMHERILTLSDEGIKIGKEFILKNSIESIIFTNELPKIKHSYISHVNQVYCIIKFKNANKAETITFQPLLNLWVDLQYYIPDKFKDLTNGEATKLAIELVVPEGFKKPNRAILFMKIWNIVFALLFLLSLIFQTQLNNLFDELPVTIPVIIGFVSVFVNVIAFFIFMPPFKRKL